MSPRSDEPATADAAPSHARLARKEIGLARMQRLAATLLCASLGLLVISVLCESRWPALRWLQAFSEASAIGAIADWYAVVALFRRPLGLPIPHTAIIPRNKDSIGRSLGEFVAQYLLTPENVVARLERYDTATQVATWFAAPANASVVAAKLTSFVPALLRAPEDADVRRFLRQTIAPKLLELDVARIAGRALQLLIDAGLHRAALERTLGAFDRWLLANEDLIRTRFAQASKYTPAAFDSYVVRKFMAGVSALVHEVVSDPGHPLRDDFERALREFVHSLGHSPEHRDAARAWLRRVLETFSGDEDLRQLRSSLAAHVESDLAQPGSALKSYGAALIAALAQGALRDRAVIDRLNAAWLGFVRTLTLQHRGQVATLIAEVVKQWDANEVGRKIELEIGRDLQFIRINGALVGGAVGLLLHACTLLLR